MNPILTAALPLVLGATVCAAQQIDPLLNDGRTISYEVNGLRVIQRPSGGNQIVTVNLYLLGGCRQLTPATAGIEVLALEASAGGTRRYPGTSANIAFRRTGSRLRIVPDPDYVGFGFAGLADQFDSAWAAFADRIVAPTLDSASVANARARMRLEFHRRDQNPVTVVQRIADSVALAGHPYAIDPRGTAESMDHITVDAVRQYVATQFVTSRMLLIIVGPISREHAEQVVAATLGTLPTGKYTWTTPPPLPTHDHTTLTMVDRGTRTNYLFGVFNGPPVTNADYMALRAALVLLNSSLADATAKQNAVIRPDPTITYGVRAQYTSWAIGVGGLYSMTDSPSLVIPLMRRQVEFIQKADFPLWSLEDYFRRYTTAFYQAQATGAGQSDQLARAQILLGDYRRADDEFNAMQTVSAPKIRAAAQYFIRRIQFVYLGEARDLDQSLLDGW